MTPAGRAPDRLGSGTSAPGEPIARVARGAVPAPAKRLLWITPKWPLPANDGARQATTQLVAGLCSRGAIIDLLAIVPEGEPASEREAIEVLGVARASLIRRPKSGRARHLRNLGRHPLRAVTLAQYSNKALSQRLNEVVCEPETVAVFDGLHAAAWLYEMDTWPDVPFIYRAHNVESDLWVRAAARKRGPAAWLLNWQGHVVRKFETRLCQSAQRVLTVSDEDAARFRSLAETAHVDTLRIGMDPKPQREHPADGTQILFIGRLDWPPNRDGLKWFLDRVWPKVKGPFTLNIVGSGDGSWLTPHLRDSRIKFHGMVDSVTPYYHAAIVNIVPIFYGSGTRVKAIESSLFATACVGTEQGLEGLGFDPKRHYFRAESEAEWVEALNALDPEAARERGRNALELAAEGYDRDRIADQFLQTMGEL